jgi:hypothetical protein
MIFVLLVCGWLTLNTGGVVYLLVKADLALRRKMLFGIAALASIALKVILATRGHNYDVDSYEIVASLVQHGKSVYANTARYNYGPLWAFFLAGLKQLSTCLPSIGRETFHLTIAAFLAVTDVAIAAILVSAYSYGAGLFFLCSPVVALLSGYHSQFDNVALLIGLSSWLLIRDGSSTPRRIGLAALLEGLSLAIKHVLFLFPVWVLFWRKLRNKRERFAYAVIAYAVFTISFLPWVNDPLSRAGILDNVFRYRSEFHLSVSYLIAAAHPFGKTSPVELRFLSLAWMAAVIATGVLVARGTCELFPLYLLALFGFSPALTDQYLAIPTLASAVVYSSWPTWALSGAATLTLLVSPRNVLRVPMNAFYITFMPSIQICALVLFIMQRKAATTPRTPRLPARVAVVRGVTLALVSAAFIFALVLVRS